MKKEYFPRSIKHSVREWLTVDRLIKRLQNMKKHCKSGKWGVMLFEEKDGLGRKISAIGFDRACCSVYLEISE